MNRKFYLIDREDGNKKRRITMQLIIDHFVGDGTGPVRWNRGNVDLDRFREEMDEIGFDFVIEIGPARTSSRLISLEKRLKTARKKLKALRDSRPDGRCHYAGATATGLGRPA